MNKRAFRLIFVLLAGLFLTLGTVWVMAAETAVTPTNTTASTDLNQIQAVTAGIDWLVTTHQNDDGGYSDFSGGANLAPSGASGTLDAIQAIAAAGYNPAANYPGKSSNPVTYLQNNPTVLANFASTGGGPAGKTILGLSAASQNPRDFIGYNFVISLTSQLSPTGQYNANTAINQSLALLALAAINETAPVSATQWLKDQQAANGSWDDGFGTDNNPDATSMAIMALVAQNEPLTSTTIVSATDFLASTQLLTGGWEYGTGFGENANTTALVVQALKVLGEDFYSSGGNWNQNATSPLAALLNWQSSSGAFQVDFGTGPLDDFYATVQSIPAAAGKAFPLPARYEAARQAISCLATLQDSSTGGWEQFAGFGINAAGTSRAIEAVAAFGGDPQAAEWTPGSVNAVDALEALTPAYVADGRGGRLGVVMQGVVAAGAPYTVTNFAGYNLPISVTNYLSPTGEYDSTAFGPQSHNEAMLGMIASGNVPDALAVTWLQNAAINGSWGGADSDGSSINVLARLGAEIPQGAFANLRHTQQADGGWGYGVPASINSTAEVVQGLVQAGDNPFAPVWSVVMSGTIQNAADAVLLQQSDSGCWLDYSGTVDDPFSTTDAVLVLMADPVWSAAERPSYFEWDLYLPLVSKQ